MTLVLGESERLWVPAPAPLPAATGSSSSSPYGAGQISAVDPISLPTTTGAACSKHSAGSRCQPPSCTLQAGLVLQPVAAAAAIPVVSRSLAGADVLGDQPLSLHRDRCAGVIRCAPLLGALAIRVLDNSSTTTQTIPADLAESPITKARGSREPVHPLMRSLATLPPNWSQMRAGRAIVWERVLRPSVACCCWRCCTSKYTGHVLC